MSTATKAVHIVTQLTPTQREQIKVPALVNEPVSSFIVLAALERESTVVPVAYFDHLVSSLDEAEDAPWLAHAAP